MGIGWSDGALEARMQRGWRGGLKEGTPCGNGTLLKNTANIRAWLPIIFRSYGIESMCDAGAGDGHWRQNALDEFDYRAFDLVPRKPGITQIDITKDKLPDCDAIICRHVLIHLDPPRIRAALELFAQSARYLFASQYPIPYSFDPANQFNRTNLAIAPYGLDEPIEQIQDAEEPQCFLAMWDLDKCGF